MHILIVGSNLPSDDQEAVQRVQFELQRYFITQGHTVSNQIIFDYSDTSWSGEKVQFRFDILRKQGVQMLQPIVSDIDYRLRKARGIKRLVHGGLRRLFPGVLPIAVFYPWVRIRTELADRIQSLSPDIILLFWSLQALAATYGLHIIPKYLYYGEPDHKPPASRALFPEFFDDSVDGMRRWLQSWKNWKSIARIETIHLKMVADCDAVRVICNRNASAYRTNGILQAQYLQNAWSINEKSPPVISPSIKRRQCKIVGSVGNLRGTGNTFAFHYLVDSLIPALERIFKENQYTVYIFGKGRPYSSIEDKLHHPRIVLRGWVKDIDQEIVESDIFLILNNVIIGDKVLSIGNHHWPLGGMHTRFLHAWSLRTCVVAHAANLASIPELIHGKNVLLGSTPEEIANWIWQVYRDQKLRRYIAEGGYSTLQQYFTPEKVGAKMLQEFEQLISTHIRTP